MKKHYNKQTRHKRQATFCDHVRRREKLDHLVTTAIIKGIHSKGKQQEKILDYQGGWVLDK